MRFGVACSSLGIIVLTACTTPNPGLSDDGTGTSSGSAAATTTNAVPTTTAPPTTSTTATSAPTGAVDTTTTDTDPATTDRPTDTEDTDAPPACGAGNVCVSEAPAGWSGPAVWAETATAEAEPECPTAYPEKQVTAFDDLVAPAADCDCSCGTASGASCGQITLEDHGNDGTCAGGATATHSLSAGCDPDPDGINGHEWIAPEPGVTGGSCSPSASVEVADSTWDSRSTVCGGAVASSTGCGGGESCVEAPAEGFQSRICVWQAGDLDCPDSSAYGDRFLRHTGVDDDRDCADCTCGSPTGECDGTILLWTGNDCTGPGGIPSAGISIGGPCVTATANVGGGEITNSVVANVECEPSVGTAVGEAEPDEPITLCCQDV